MNTAAKQVATVEPSALAQAAPPSETAAILSMIERAARDPAVDIDKMERLLQMHERVMARQAQAEFTAALADLQQELPVIQERGEIKIGSGKPQKYALWEDINEAIKPSLAKHGFALSFRTGRDNERISVTGILSHRGGHREETTMHLPLDTSGSKNNVQAVGSSTSYGKRYTAAALLNLTSRGEDDDGKAAGIGATISDEQVATLIALADDVGADKIAFCRFLKVDSIAAIPAARFNDAVAALEQKRAKRGRS